MLAALHGGRADGRLVHTDLEVVWVVMLDGQAHTKPTMPGPAAEALMDRADGLWDCYQLRAQAYSADELDGTDPLAFDLKAPGRARFP